MNSGILDYTAWDIGAVSYGICSPSTDYMSDIYTYYMAQIIGSAGNGDRKGVSGSYGRNKFSPSSTGQIFTYSVFDNGYVDTDAVGKGWYVTDSCGIK